MQCIPVISGGTKTTDFYRIMIALRWVFNRFSSSLIDCISPCHWFKNMGAWDRYQYLDFLVAFVRFLHIIRWIHQLIRGPIQGSSLVKMLFLASWYEIIISQMWSLFQRSWTITSLLMIICIRNNNINSSTVKSSLHKPGSLNYLLYKYAQPSTANSVVL